MNISSIPDTDSLFVPKAKVFLAMSKICIVVSAFAGLSLVAQPTFAELHKPPVKDQTSSNTQRSPNNAASDGAKGDKSIDDGPKIKSVLDAAGMSGIIAIPHATNGYRLSSGTFTGGHYPSQAWSWPDNTDVYPSPGILLLGNNRFQGAAVGNPDNCTGKLTNPYTQTCLAATDYKIIMDPASIWAGGQTTNVGMTIGCLPNHRNPNRSNLTSGGYLRNWIACMYQEVDTGQDGQSHANGSGFGSDISTEFLNGTLSVGSNHGIFREINVNVYGAVKDGGITRSDFILSSCGPFSSGTYSGVISCQASVKAGKSPWGVTSEIANAIEISATPFSSLTAPAGQTNGHGEVTYKKIGGRYLVYPRWTNGILVNGSVNNFVAQGSVEGESGYSFQAKTIDGTQQFSVDKVDGNVSTKGNIKAGSYISAQGSIQIDGAIGHHRYIHIDTSGSARWEIGADNSSESTANSGSDFYISRRTDAGAPNGTPLSISRAEGIVKIERALQLPAYTVDTLPNCNAAYKGVLAYVSDAKKSTYNVVPIGGGSNAIPVFCNGSDWTMH